MATARNSFVWYELMTSDVASAKAFYAKVVGWTTEDMPMPGMTYTLVRVGDTQVGGLMPLPPEASAAGMRSCWIGYVGIEDADGAAAHVKRLGGRILGEPRDIPGVGRFAMVTDPQGAAFNLFKPNQSGERAASSAPGHIGWHELHTTDWPKALSFYVDVLDWLKGDSVDMGPLGTYQLFNVRGVPAGAMFNDPMVKVAPFWLYYFNVEDIDDAAKRVADAGGTIVRGAQQVPGGSWIVEATDPQGARFALLGSKK